MKAEIILNNIVMTLEYFTFFYVVMRRTFRTKDITRLIICSFLGVVWLGAMIGGLDWNDGLIGPVPLLLIPLILFLWLLFEISVVESIVFGITTWLGLSLIEENLLIALKRPGLDDNGLELGIMLSITGGAWLIYVLTRKNGLFFFPIKVWVLLDVIMLILMTMLSFFAYVIVDMLPKSETIVFGRNLLLLGGIAIVFFLFVFLYYCSSAYYNSVEKKLVETQMVQQQNYYEQLLLREEDTRRFRHDVINDFLEIKNFCDNQECQQMKDYMEKLTGTVLKLSRNHYDVGNNVINVILNYYLFPISSENEVRISGHLSERLDIDDRELCIVCANLVQNAAEAVKKSSDGIIKINFSEGRDYILMEIINSFQDVPQFDEGGCLKTSKIDAKNHGMGIRSIKEIVKRNNGSFNIELLEGFFKVEVYLKKHRSRVKKTVRKEWY